MVQANADGRPRSRRARQSEEQAPLVESYLSSSGSTSYQGRARPGEGLGRARCCGLAPPSRRHCCGEPLTDFRPAGAAEGLLPSGCSGRTTPSPGGGRPGPGVRGPCMCSGILRLWAPWRVFLEHRPRARGRAGPAERLQPLRRERVPRPSEDSFCSPVAVSKSLTLSRPIFSPRKVEEHPVSWGFKNRSGHCVSRGPVVNAVPCGDCCPGLGGGGAFAQRQALRRRGWLTRGPWFRGPLQPRLLCPLLALGVKYKGVGSRG